MNMDAPKVILEMESLLTTSVHLFSPQFKSRNRLPVLT